MKRNQIMSLDSYNDLLKELEIMKAAKENDGFTCTLTPAQHPLGMLYTLSCQPPHQETLDNTPRPGDVMALGPGIFVIAAAGIHWLRQTCDRINKEKNTVNNVATTEQSNKTRPKYKRKHRQNM